MNHPSSTQETPPSPPMFTNAQLKALLLPLLLEQFLSVSMGLADTVMVSGVGEAAVSSVSLVDSLNVLIIQILSALATGGAVVASQYLGRKDKKNAQLSAAQLFSVLIMLTVISIQYVHNLIYVRGVYKPYVSDILRFPRWWVGVAVPIGFGLSVIYSIWFLLTDRLHIIKVKPSDDDDDYKVEEGNF